VNTKITIKTLQASFRVDASVPSRKTGYKLR